MNSLDRISRESGKEYAQDIIFGIAFLSVAVLAGWRMTIYFDPNGGGKVITAFYALIFSTSCFRSIWFLIPKSTLEGSYTPLPLIAFVSRGWKGFLFSEIIVDLGSLSLYAVFILIVCYWSHMLRKVETPAVTETNLLSLTKASLARYPRVPAPKRGPMLTFALVMLFLLIAEAVNVILFLKQTYNSEMMILIDSMIITLMSLITLVEITVFSQRIRLVLAHLGVINANSTRPQIRRILAVTVAANFFFIWRAATELILVFLLLYLWSGIYIINFYYY